MSKSSDVKSVYLTKKVGDVAGVESQQALINRMGEVDEFSHDELERLKVVYPGMSNPSMLNTFRELRTQLVQLNNKSNFVCMVSSLCNGGGGSYIAGNLAAVFALDKAKTSMLIDANLYAPSVDSFIPSLAEAGITDYLSGAGLSVEDVVYATGIPRMRAVPIGGNREGAAEYFSSQKMLRFIEEIRSRYPDRYIFIDAPPILESSEARILSEISDTVVLVVPYGKVVEDQVSSAIQVVGSSKLSGIVYNNQ